MNADENLAAARAHLGGESVSLDEADRRVREAMNRGALPPHDKETGEICEKIIPKQEIAPPAPTLAAAELRLLIERVERLEEEKSVIGSDVKDVYAEAKARGYDPKTMKAVVKLRKMEANVRQEAEALLDTYKSALGLGTPYSTRHRTIEAPTPLELAATE